jgi:hypothetical protein
MAGREYSNKDNQKGNMERGSIRSAPTRGEIDSAPPRGSIRSAPTRKDIPISPRIATNNALSETVAKNESLGMAEYSPLTLLGKATNYVAGKIAGDSETGRVIRSSVKASDIVKSRRK